MAHYDLPRGEGFPYKYRHPEISIVTYKALRDGGMKQVADQVLSVRKIPQATLDTIATALDLFRSNRAPVHTSASYQKALAKLRIDLNISEKIPVASFTKSVGNVNLNENPGLPFIRTQPGKRIGDVIDRAQQISDHWTSIGKGNTVRPLEDSAAFGPEDVSRLGEEELPVYLKCPLEVLIEEGRYAIPISTELHAGLIGSRTAYGLEMPRGGMEWIQQFIEDLDTDEQTPATTVSVSFRYMDSCLPGWLIGDVFSVIEEKLDFSHELEDDGKLLRINPAETLRRFRVVVDYFINTPIQLSDGRRMMKRNGILTGTHLAHLVKTACNALITDTLIGHMIPEEEYFMITYSNETLIVLPHRTPVDIPGISQFTAETFGVEIDERLSNVTDDVEEVRFLGYYSKDGSIFRDDNDQLVDLLYPWPHSQEDTLMFAVTRAIFCLMSGASQMVQRACLAIADAAEKEGVDISVAFEIEKENYQVKRHLIEMGFNGVDLEVTYDAFREGKIPVPSCIKIQQGVNLADEAKRIKLLVHKFAYAPKKNDIL